MGGRSSLERCHEAARVSRGERFVFAGVLDQTLWQDGGGARREGEYKRAEGMQRIGDGMGNSCALGVWVCKCVCMLGEESKRGEARLKLKLKLEGDSGGMLAWGTGAVNQSYCSITSANHSLDGSSPFNV